MHNEQIENEQGDILQALDIALEKAQDEVANLELLVSVRHDRGTLIKLDQANAILDLVERSIEKVKEWAIKLDSSINTQVF